MDRLSLYAEERKILGKKVKSLRREGKLPANVFGKKLESEAVSVDGKIFLKTLHEAGSTGVIDLKIGEEKVRPVMVRDVQHDPITGDLIHIDFYQVNLSEKVKVPVPVEIVGEEPESVKLGEAIVLQVVNEIEVEALPADLVEKLEVDIANLKNIDDAITVGELTYDKAKLTISLPEDEIVVKLAPAVSAEMEALLEEQAAETAEAQAEEVAEEGAEAPEGEEALEPEGEQIPDEGPEESSTPEEKSGEEIKQDETK